MPLNVLVIDRAPPLRATQGNELIAKAILPLLRPDHHLTLVAPVAVDPGAAEAARDALRELVDDAVLVPRSSRVRALGGVFEEALAGRGIRVRFPVDSAAAAAFGSAVRRVVAERRPDVVHVRQIPMAGYGRLVGSTPRLLELIDSETLAASRTPGSGWRTRVRRRIAPLVERRAIDGYDLVTAVAGPDAAAIRALRAGTLVEVVPNGVDATTFRPDPATAVVPGSIAFLGAMSFAPNIAAARWFADEVLPRLVARRPEVHFTIVGRDPDPTILELADRPSVTVTGSVDDVRPWLASAAVVVAPMVSGSGIKNKLLEALAMGRPVVATSLAVEGLDAARDRELVVADGPDGVAEAVERLLADPARAEEIGRAGRQLVETTYTWPVAAARYAALYAELAARRASHR